MVHALGRESVTRLGMAGLGAMTAGFLQSTAAIPVTDNVRDVVLVVLAALAGTMGGRYLAPYALGVGAVAVGSLITRNVISAIR